MRQLWVNGPKRAHALLVACAAAVFLSGCSGGVPDFINTKTKFTESKFGKASPRMTTSRHVRKGGGRQMVGKPYQVAGRWYHPKHDPNYDETGGASWYGPNFHGRQTANGEIFDQFALTAAHPTLPLPSYVRVTNLENGRSVMVRVNDRGPFVHGREIDLSAQAAEMLGYRNGGVARVRVKYVGPAPLEGDDTRMLMASYNAPTQMERGGSRQPETRLAMREERRPEPARRPEPVRQAPPAQIDMALAAPQPAAPPENVLVTPEGFNVVVATGATSAVLGPLFYAAHPSAAQSNDIIDSAFAATEAMARSPGALDSWKEGVDADARNVRVALGTFADTRNAENVIQAFSMIGAVDSADVWAGTAAAQQLTLTQLKPGATRGDIVATAATLGLEVQFLYD